MIKLMADYESYPLWYASEDRVGNIDPASLPISDLLMYDLMVWAEQYDQTLNYADPARSGFENKEAKEKFRLQGADLRRRLQIELGTAYKVI